MTYKRGTKSNLSIIYIVRYIRQLDNNNNILDNRKNKYFLLILIFSFMFYLNSKPLLCSTLPKQL